MQYWRLCGLRNERGQNDPLTVQCIVAANSKVEALQELNKVFKYQVTSQEFEAMWGILKESIFTEPGVYERRGEHWTKRGT